MTVPLLTVKEVAATLKCGHTYVYTLIARGELQAIKLDRLTRISTTALEEFLHEKSGLPRQEQVDR